MVFTSQVSLVRIHLWNFYKFIWVTSLKNRKLTAPQIKAQMNATQSSNSRHISTPTVQRRLSESGLYSQIAAKIHYEGQATIRMMCLGQETQGMDIRLVEICALVWFVQIWDLWFHLPCLYATQKRWMKPWSMEEEVWWCGGASLVTLLGIYSKLKAHWTSMATTASCSDMPSHRVCIRVRKAVIRAKGGYFEESKT